MMTAKAIILTKPKAMFMILSIVSGKERSDNPVPATSGEARPWAEAGCIKVCARGASALGGKSAKLKIKEIKIPPEKIYGLSFFKESMEYLKISNNKFLINI